MRSLFKTLAASLVLAGTLAFHAPAASAGCHAAYTPPCHYKTVVTYEYVRKSYVNYVTQYASCGTPYRVRQVSWKTVRVPVTRQVKVCY